MWVGGWVVEERVCSHDHKAYCPDQNECEKFFPSSHDFQPYGLYDLDA